MKTKEDLKNTYIEIRGNKKLSKAVQEKLFEIGFKWHGDDKAIYYDMQESYMIMDEDFDLTECDREIIECSRIYPEDLGVSDDELERGITITNVDKSTDPALDTKTLRQEFCKIKGWNYLEFDTLTEAEEYILFLENKLKDGKN